MSLPGQTPTDGHGSGATANPPPVFGQASIPTTTPSGMAGRSPTPMGRGRGRGRGGTMYRFGESRTIPTELPPINFDYGDLRLTVGNRSTQDMTVDSRALGRASPVLHKMLSGNFKEATPATGEWHVKLPEDDAAAFAVLMTIIHGSFERTPASVSINALYEMAVLTDKYDMTKTLKPMAEKWLEWVEWIEGAGTVNEQAKYLFVAWEMGHATLFSSLMNRIAERCKIINGHLCDEDFGQPIESIKGIAALNISDALEKHRKQVLDITVDQCNILASTLILETDNPYPIHHPISHKGRDVCQERMLAKLIQGAHRQSIISLFNLESNPPSFNWSVRGLMESLKMVGNRASMTRANQACDPMSWVLKAIREKRAQIPDLLSDRQRTYLAEQAAKTGLV
ncbi:Fc.00g067540.m01.CDS01 [Cosmosporella sp. VM-42]